MPRMLSAALVAASILTAAPVAPAADTAYWQARGCDHGHRSAVAYRRTTALLRNQSPLTRAEGRRVRHYVACVSTRAKSRAIARHVRGLKAWRRAHVCTTARGNAELGRCLALRDHGWGAGEFGCLDALWGGRESGWSVYAHNPSSGAHGIPQALPGSKMGAGWWDNPFVQIGWGLGYIAGRYGTPCGALAWHNGHHWY